MGERVNNERPLPVTAVAADAIAEMRLRETTESSQEIRCDACDEVIEGEAAGSGLFLWSRGDDDVRIEEPALCPRCATAIGITAIAGWTAEEEEG